MRAGDRNARSARLSLLRQRGRLLRGAGLHQPYRRSCRCWGRGLCRYRDVCSPKCANGDCGIYRQRRRSPCRKRGGQPAAGRSGPVDETHRDHPEMTNDASAYLGELNRLLSVTEIRDRVGNALPLDEGGKAALDLIRQAKKGKAKAVVIGNGGSAAIASHMQNDLCKAVRMRALVFTEQSLLTALANDDGYQTAYETMINLWAEPNNFL